MSVLQTVQKKTQQQQFTYGQTVQKNNKQFTDGQTVQKNNNDLHMDRQCKKKKTIYIWTDSAKKTNNLHMDRQCKKTTNNLHMDRQCKKAALGHLQCSRQCKKNNSNLHMDSTYLQTIQKTMCKIHIHILSTHSVYNLHFIYIYIYV